MASPTKDTGLTLTPREIEVLSKVWKCLKVPPEIDLPKLAQECGMTNVGSASNAWGRIKKKLFAAENGAAGSSTSTETPPVTPSRKRKTMAATATGEDYASEDKDAGDGPATMMDDAAEDSGAAEGPTTPKRRRVPTAGGSAKAGAKRAPRTPKKTPVKVEESDDGDATMAIASVENDDQDTLADGSV